MRAMIFQILSPSVTEYSPLGDRSGESALVLSAPTNDEAVAWLAAILQRIGGGAALVLCVLQCCV